MIIILDKLPREQAGFRQEYHDVVWSCVNQIAILRIIIEQTVDSGKHLIDFQKAIDSIDHNTQWDNYAHALLNCEEDYIKTSPAKLY